MDKQTFTKLEFDKIIKHLRAKCHTPLGIEKIERLSPKTDFASIKKDLDETFEMSEILKFEEPFVLQTLDPVDVFFDKLRVEQTFLEPADYLKVAHFLRVSQSLKRYMKGKGEKYPLIADYISGIQTAPEVIERIEKAIDRVGEIKDSASSALRKIRIDKQLIRNKILAKLEALIQSKRPSGTRQDDLITFRDGRYVIPMAASEFTSKSGVIHGRSKSGATFFVEPMTTVEMNNQLRSLIIEEEQEIERILIEIGDSIRLKLPLMEENYRLIGQIDFIHSKARLALELDCDRPELVDSPQLNLKQARHPLLLISASNKENVIPMDIDLGEGFECLVITGPNMGGKTVSLKTVGLLTLMTQAGMLIPVGKDSTMGIFDHVFADIGDEQSIELSLSTFSSHISKIIGAIKRCGRGSMILMDELGAGTDPLEGSALGEAILTEILERNGKAMITTHYSALKTLAEKNRRIENASLEFDNATLAPTYRLRIGLPGSSYAIEMAKRLGMPQEVVNKAVGLVGTQERNLARLIEKLQAETRAAEEEREAIAEQKKAINELQEFYLDRKAKIEAEQKTYKAEALKEAEELIESTRTDLERLVKKIRETEADKESVKNAHSFIKKKKDEFKTRLSKLAPKTKSKKEALNPGDRVFIENLRAEGELLDYVESSKSWRVQTGSMVASVKTGLLRKLEKKEPRPSLPKGVNYAPFDDITTQISVRGMTAEEAIDAVEKYLDSASLANLETVFILHGKGTGVLRKAINDYLKTNRMVREFRLGYFNEGGTGVTVVSLKRN
jgi:DNA mismatch repair protein MutS2